MKMLTEILKEETRAAHTNAEVLMGAKSIFADNYSIPQYYQHLQRLLKMHSTAHLIFNAYAHIIPEKNWIPVNRTFAIIDDLQTIDKAFLAPQASLKESHGFTKLPALIGVMYVIKGSELGGNIIASRIIAHNKRWQLPQQKFYQQEDPSSVKQNWISWCDKINSLPTNNDFVNQALAGAKNGFHLCVHPQEFSDVQVFL